MKIGDLWVKLGLKKDEFDKGIKEAGEQVSGTSGGLLSKIKGLATGSVAAFAAIGAAAIAMADKFAHTSQRLGDQWDQVTAGLKASWRTFVAAVNSTDFSNIGKRLADAFRDAKDVAASADAEFEVMNSINLQKSAMSQELESLRVLMQNQKLSQKERIAAAEEYLAKLKPIYEKEEAYRKSHAEKMVKAYLSGAQLNNGPQNQRYLSDFLTNIAPNDQLTTALDHFAKGGYSTITELESRLLGQLRDQQYGGNEVALEALAKIAQYYKSTADDTAKPLVDAIVAANYAAGAFDQETRRVQSIANQSTGAGGGSEDAGKKRADAVLKRAKDAAKGELQILTEKYDEEKALLQSYNLDTEALWKEFINNLRDYFDVKLSDLKVDIDLDLDDVDVSDVDAEIGAFIDGIMTEMERAQELVDEFKEAAVGGFSDAVQELADQLAGLEEVNPGRVVQALLTPLADMAIKEGEILIATGIGVEAVKEALSSLQGPAAIAAGATLVAIGAAAKSGLAALANSGGRGATAATKASTAVSAGGTQALKTEITVFVKGTLRGSDIVLSGQKTVNNWNR